MREKIPGGPFHQRPHVMGLDKAAESHSTAAELEVLITNPIEGRRQWYQKWT